MIATISNIYIYVIGYWTVAEKRRGKWEKATDLKLDEFEDTKGVIRVRKSKDRQNIGQKNKQRPTKHYTED